MKSSVKLALGALGAAGLALPTHAATVPSGTPVSGTASVIIRNRPLAVAEAGGLYFGDFTPSSGGDGVISVPAMPSGASAQYGTTSGAHSDRFDITGQPSAAYTVSLNSTYTTLAGPSGNLPVSNLTLSNTSGTMSSGGTSSFYVGGTLTVPSGTTSGTYSGTFGLTVDYS